MKREIHVCDRCGEYAETPEELSALKLTSISVGRSSSYPTYQGVQVYAVNKSWDGEWCAACCKDVGVDHILPDNIKRNGSMNAEAQTLETMIREIVRQELPSER